MWSAWLGHDTIDPDLSVESGVGKLTRTIADLEIEERYLRGVINTHEKAILRHEGAARLAREDKMEVETRLREVRERSRRVRAIGIDAASSEEA